MAAIWPSIEGSMDELMDSYPPELKEAFNIRELTTVEAYIDAEMLSFIVPFALAFLAVRVIVRLVSGAEERGYLDIVLTAPVARRVLVAGAVAVAAIVVAVVLAVVTGDDLGRSGTLVGTEPVAPGPRARHGQRVAAGDVLRRASPRSSPAAPTAAAR